MPPKNGTPVDERYIRPKAAEKKFKLAKELGQTVYLYGITGSGKTALVKDMLRSSDYLYFPAEETSPEQLEGLEDGTVRIVVLDGLEKIQSKGQREVYAKRLRALSIQRNVWLILISRCRIPNWLMQLHMENAFLVIGEQDFQFDRLEQDAYLEAWNIKLDSKTADQLWTLAGGKPLFLRFVALAGGNLDQAVNDMWNYLCQVYDQWDPEIQEFVLETSVVERFDIRMAQLVTGRSDAQRILKKAMETGNFYKETDGMYELDSSFRSGIQMQLERKFDRDRRTVNDMQDLLQGKLSKTEAGRYGADTLNDMYPFLDDCREQELLAQYYAQLNDLDASSGGEKGLLQNAIDRTRALIDKKGQMKKEFINKLRFIADRASEALSEFEEPGFAAALDTALRETVGAEAPDGSEGGADRGTADSGQDGTAAGTDPAPDGGGQDAGTGTAQ